MEQEREGVAVELVSRVQLRAVLSGLAVSGGVFAVCMGICWAIGLSTFRPTVDHARGLALGNLIWGAIAVWISLFFGGYIAALVGRSPDAKSGILHGIVVWGATAVFAGLFLVAAFSGLLGAIVRMSEAGAAPAGGAGPALVQTAGLTTWFYWAGIVGGLLTSIAGGFAGARIERKAPERRAVEAPIRGGVAPRPSY